MPVTPQQIDRRLELQDAILEPTILALADTTGAVLDWQQRELDSIVRRLKRAAGECLKEQDGSLDEVLHCLATAAITGLTEREIVLKTCAECIPDGPGNGQPYIQRIGNAPGTVPDGTADSDIKLPGPAEAPPPPPPRTPEGFNPFLQPPAPDVYPTEPVGLQWFASCEYAPDFVLVEMDNGSMIPNLGRPPWFSISPMFGYHDHAKQWFDAHEGSLYAVCRAKPSEPPTAPEQPRPPVPGSPGPGPTPPSAACQPIRPCDVPCGPLSGIVVYPFPTPEVGGVPLLSECTPYRLMEAFASKATLEPLLAAINAENPEESVWEYLYGVASSQHVTPPEYIGPIEPTE